MEDLTTILVESESMIHVAAAGAGMELSTILAGRPGASSWLSGLSYPYDREETNSLLGFKPDGYVNMDTAIELAMVAYMNAYRYAGLRTIGVGIEGSIAGLKLHHGDHRIHACVITPNTAVCSTVILDKRIGEKARAQDDHRCSELVHDLIATALGKKSYVNFTVLSNQELLDKILHRSFFRANRERESELWFSHKYSALMPGAFNPPHDRHHFIASSVESFYQVPVTYHITIDSPHKPTLAAQDILERVRLLRGRDVIVTQGDPLYIQKAERFRDKPIVMGTDALERLFDPRWGTDVDATLDRFRELGTRFFVAARDQTLLETLEKHRRTAWSDLFRPIHGSRDNTSSTQIRNESGARDWRSKELALGPVQDGEE